MAQDVYKLTTLNLFEDLKNTNISNGEFKEIIASYLKLGQEYIKANQADLFKDLNKQKEVIFSYLPTFKKESLKKLAHLHKALEAEMGNLDEIDTLNTPEKQVQFIKVAYNNGKWTISTKNLEDLEFTNKETPEAINSLVSLCDRLDEQEAAYALCHAKKAGLFTMAALPYVRTEDLTNTALEQKFTKDPGTVLGPVEHSWESSVDNTNMPVSRQIASEDSFQEMDTFKDEDGDTITISSISGDAVITFDNDIYTKEEVEENIESGYWTKVEADQKDIKVRRLLKQADALCDKIYHEKLVMDEAARRKLASTEQAIKEAQAAETEKLEQLQLTIEPKIRKIAAKIDSITFNDEECAKKCQRLKENLESGLTLTYSRPVEQFQKRTVSVEKAEQVLEKIREYVSPKNLKKYDELIEDLFQFTSKAESFNISLTQNDPRNEEMIQEELEKLNKNIKTSQNDAFIKNQAYEELDNLIVAGLINFDQYNKLSDYAELDSNMVLDSVKTIKSGLQEVKQADLIEDVVTKIKDLYNSAKDWIMDKLSFFTLQDKEIKDINEELDELI